ncbi:hypothetical protein GN958_ATG18611, partial [Phytophthora infestans]
SVPAERPRSSTSPSAQEQRHQLVVRLIVKSTIRQRNTSGNTVDDVIVNGQSFNDIIPKLWDLFSEVMHLKVKQHLGDTTKSEQGWKQWLVKMRGETVEAVVDGVQVRMLPRYSLLHGYFQSECHFNMMRIIIVSLIRYKFKVYDHLDYWVCWLIGLRESEPLSFGNFDWNLQYYYVV